jgi:hypothetical protein
VGCSGRSCGGADGGAIGGALRVGGRGGLIIIVNKGSKG